MLFSSNRSTFLCGANFIASLSAASASCGTLTCYFMNILSEPLVSPIGQRCIDAVVVVVPEAAWLVFRDLSIGQPAELSGCW
ncbi:hypothetical protein CGRA01v4_04995 [Colletotrichum graminicola]|nr:hypothetical protein CGRA01v4_04995 [Colletotrichum graminicola]